MNLRISTLRVLRLCVVAVLVTSPFAVSLAQQGGNLPANGNGPYGGDPGMMGGCDGDCMGAGMMDSGMGGPGMMGGNGYGCGVDHAGWDPGLKLSHDQQTRMNAIVDQSRKDRWLLMGKMLDEQSTLRDLYASPKRDQAAIDASYATMRDLRKQMYGIAADEHKRIDALLTREQRERLREY
ncbi:Spy/CpxP family protein refolding chaperone [Paraburkholderia lycopersici]|uniref:LTXXQ motif family protein n=1 Tax=Paraburkholderia lycopersici TaxID=416944 RepID=A0A1G7CYD1_9BURK|nr:Spy/CpxP family protein refolding chaperone [Paraburkholderia lycopersici]SDE44243.1 LTXXQ motif family protein [Paraburkholderia lycopersici]